MKTEVRVTKSFKKAIKPLLKKYASLFNDLAALETELLENPRVGTSLGSNAYKIRLKIKSKSKGKSGGARVVSLVETEIVGIVETVEELTVVNLIMIYDKAERQTITDAELRDLIKNLEV